MTEAPVNRRLAGEARQFEPRTRWPGLRLDKRHHRCRSAARGDTGGAALVTVTKTDRPGWPGNVAPAESATAVTSTAAYPSWKEEFSRERHPAGSAGACDQHAPAGAAIHPFRGGVAPGFSLTPYMVPRWMVSVQLGQ